MDKGESEGQPPRGKTFHGSCHCGAVAFEVDLDLAAGIHKCNCTFCRKTGYQKVFAAGDALTITKGRPAEYLPSPSHWPPGDIHHYYCIDCGVHPFSQGKLDQMGGVFWAANVACFDDVSEAELAAAPLVYEDGLHDRQQETPAVTSYL